jgi:exopolyphosphatase/guanosine-5'-triphosphate,3'-diphosphate pyrophosphatase
LGTVIDDLVKAGSVAERRRLPGLDEKRADIILAGALIFEQVVETFGIESILMSGFALREGVLLDTLHRSTGGTLHHLQDVSRRSVMGLMRACDDEPEHSERVSRLAMQLFDATADIHGLHIDNREYLEAAALLANVGLVISHSKHHLHSYYVIRNSERLLGFTDGEIEIIAQVARYHRKSAPKLSHSEFARLRPEDQRVVKMLAALLRVAIGLDRSHKGIVTGLEVSQQAEGLEIRVQADGDAGLDIYNANERRGLLEEVLELPVKVMGAAG